MRQTVRYGGWGQGSLTRAATGEKWVSVLSVKGIQHEFSTGTEDLKAARKFHKQKLDELVRGTFKTPSQAKLLFSALLDARQADFQLRGGRDLSSFVSHAKPVRAYFGSWRAQDIKSQDIDAYVLARRAEGMAAGSINRELGVLSSTLRLGVAQEQLAKAPQVRRLPENNVREGFFSRPEVEAVISHLPEHLRDVVRFAYLTGWRKGEILTLRWSDVDLDVGVIKLRAEESKNAQGRTIVLVGELLELMKRRQSARLLPTLLDRIKEAKLVFHHRGGRPIAKMDKSWDNACQAAGIPGRHFHDLRRSGVRNMIRGGVPETVAMKISGHKTRSMLDRYNIVSTEDLTAAARAVQTYVDTLPTERNA